MTRTHMLIAAVCVVLATGITGALYIALGRSSQVVARPAAAPPSTEPAAGQRKIKAELFYVAEDGLRLTGVEREVAYGEGSVEQARAILDAQIAPVDAPLVSAIPAGTAVRAVFVTPEGEAFVDLSRDVAALHSGGSLNEQLTIYTIVDALTYNLPAIKTVQVLVDGKEVDTLAGHIDLRRPL